MTDLEITDEQAMGLLWWLIERGTVTASIFGFTFHDHKSPKFVAHKLENKDVFKRAIVECVAKTQVDLANR